MEKLTNFHLSESTFLKCNTKEEEEKIQQNRTFVYQLKRLISSLNCPSVYKKKFEQH